MALSKGKPIVLGEVGNPPGLEILSRQPKWESWVVWAGMVRNTSRQQYQTLVQDARVLSLDDPAYWEAIAPFRQACGLPSLPVQEKPVDFSGTWILNEEKSVLDNFGSANLPYKMGITQNFNRGGQTTEMVTKETWSLRERGRVLSIQQSSKSFRGERKITMIFEKQ